MHRFILLIIGCWIAWGHAQTDAELLPVGMSVNGRQAITATLVIGQIDGNQAVNFDNWLLPLFDVDRALRLNLSADAEGGFAVRTSFIITRLPADIVVQSDLGLSVPVAALREALGIDIAYDPLDSAVAFVTPRAMRDGLRLAAPPILLDGLPERRPADFAITQIEQSFTFTSTAARNRLQGETRLLATLGGGSLYLALRQPDLGRLDWRLSELQFALPGENLDIIVGSQRSFWRGNALWGASLYWRSGFSPLHPGSSGLQPEQRRSVIQQGRTLQGEAAPGTLVRLVERNVLIDEVLVDDSGHYRFDNVPFGQGIGSYELLLYPQGILSAEPERRRVGVLNVRQTLPAGAFAVSLNVGAERSNDSFLGSYQALLAGASIQYGLLDALTIGGGLVYEDGLRLFAEAALVPTDIPLQISGNLLTPSLLLSQGDSANDWFYRLTASYSPLDALRLSLLVNEQRQRFSVNYRLLPQLSLEALYSSDRGFALSARSSVRLPVGSMIIPVRSTVTVYEDLAVDATLSARAGDARFSISSIRNRLNAELSYDLPEAWLGEGHSVSLAYSDGFSNGYSFIPSYRYRSPQRSADNRPVFSASAGFDLGTTSRGLLLTAQTTLVPGFSMDGSYTGALGSATDRLSFGITGRVMEAGGLAFTHRPLSSVRGNGALAIIPFLDDNSNGVRDEGEEVVLENADLLLQIDNRPISRVVTESERIVLALAPGEYRLDLDAAGYPFNYRPVEDSYAVEIRSGAYTTIHVAFQPVYSLIGILRDAAGSPLAGTRISVVDEAGQQRSAVSNNAGVYFFEDLPRGRYQFSANGLQVSPNTVVFDENSEQFIELNLTLH